MENLLNALHQKTVDSKEFRERFYDEYNRYKRRLIHGWIEVKHAEYFNPVLLHYTTRDEQKFAESNPEYNNLIRDVEELGISIDPHSMV